MSERYVVAVSTQHTIFDIDTRYCGCCRLEMPGTGRQVLSLDFHRQEVVQLVDRRSMALTERLTAAASWLKGESGSSSNTARADS